LAKKEKSEDMSFEKALHNLEEIVEKLERGEITLEDSLKSFTEGIRLSRLCSSKLKAAEEELRKLVEKESGEIELEPFSLNGDK